MAAIVPLNERLIENVLAADDMDRARTAGYQGRQHVLAIGHESQGRIARQELGYLQRRGAAVDQYRIAIGHHGSSSGSDPQFFFKIGRLSDGGVVVMSHLRDVDGTAVSAPQQLAVFEFSEVATDRCYGNAQFVFQ